MSWDKVFSEIQNLGTQPDSYFPLRRRYLDRISKITKHNVIAYYSGWLQRGTNEKPSTREFEINDGDVNGLLAITQGLESEKGLDLILHTPGGDVAATEAIINYLKSIFPTGMRAIIPQMAMSAGTMIACACDEIIMGKHSSLGPIDPSLAGYSTYGIVREFEKARDEIMKDNDAAFLWQPIINQYPPTIVGECQNLMDWAKNIATDSLSNGMFREEEDGRKIAETVAGKLSDPNTTLTHNRHLSISQCRDLGLKICSLEEFPDLQDAILSLHYIYMHALDRHPIVKLIENHHGKANWSNLD